MYRYSLLGLVINSQHPLPPSLAKVIPYTVEEPNKSQLVNIHFLLPRDFSGQVARSRPGIGRTSILWPEIGAFHLSGGQLIEVEPNVGVDEQTLHIYLLGTVFSFILHQRGYQVLHGSSVALYPSKNLDQKKFAPEDCVCFLGHSGSGKSTMAVALQQRGHRFLSDDLTAITPNFFTALHKGPLAVPASPLVKLWPVSLEQFPFDKGQTIPLDASHEKRGVVLQSNLPTQPLPLRAAYLLEEGNEITIERLRLQEALMALVNHSFCVRALAKQEVGENFQRCAHLVKQLPVFRLVRPLRFEALPQVALAVENHQKALSG